MRSRASAERTTIHHAQMTGTTAQELVEDFLCDASPLVLDLLEKSRGEASLRAALAFEMMAIQPLTMQQHLFVRMRKLQFPCTFISYRSHVDGFMIATKDPAATWQVFDDRYQRSSASMRTLVDALRLQVQAQGPVVSTAGAEWKRILDKYVGRVLQGLEFGGLMVASDPEEAGQHLGDRYDLSVSPFHQAVYKDRPLRDAVPPAGAVWLLSGPEGGLTAEEEAAAVAAGFVPVTLGPRVLRAETAPLAVLGALLV